MDWKQYFPTYHFDEKKNRDIALEEYKFCCKIVESEERIFDSLIKYILVFGTILISLLTGTNEVLEKVFFKITENPKNMWYFLAILIILLFIFMTKNFAERQKTIIFAKRKIVMLRRMLGIDYGTQEFLFKKGMLEGASMPFSIKLNFHYLYWIIPILCFITLFIIGIFIENSLIFIFAYSAFISLALVLLYVHWILDLNENLSLVILRKIFTIFGIKFVDNFEHILYRAKLAFYESKRLEINLDTLKETLIRIEDKRFYEHKGVDWIAIGRALVAQCRKIPIISKIPSIKNQAFSGGSTITQQLFRTLFIENIDKTIKRRKIAEICLGRLWFNSFLTKEKQLEIYLNAVRFDKKIFGAMEAMKYFYGRIIKEPSKAQCFFLIERISVVSGTMLPKAIDIIARLEKEDFLNKNDTREIIAIYEQAYEQGKIEICFKGENILEKLRKKYKNLMN